MKFIVFFLCAFLYFMNVSVFASENNESVISECSDWAENEIIRAIETGLIPPIMQKDYTQPITREEFCTLIVNMLNTLNSDIMNFGNKKNIFYEDTDNDAVISASGLDIVSGVGNNKFNPNGSITRQEASRMLYMTSTLGKRYPEINKYLSEKIIEMNNSIIIPHIFRDGAKIQNWAQESINYCYMYGIMQGIDNNRFDISGNYSREQSYITILRLYDLYKNGKTNMLDRNYIYRKKDKSNKEENWGYINEKNQWIIKPFSDYTEYAGEFEGNYAVLDFGGAVGLKAINQKGEVVLGGYRHGNRFGDIVSFENCDGTINLNTGEIIGENQYIKNFSSGIGEVITSIKDINTDLYGYYNTDGKMVIPKNIKKHIHFIIIELLLKRTNNINLLTVLEI